jgi:hypothetical protein
MDEALRERIKAAVAGMSTKEVAEAIASSKHSGVADPLALAALMKSW